MRENVPLLKFIRKEKGNILHTNTRVEKGSTEIRNGITGKIQNKDSTPFAESWQRTKDRKKKKRRFNRSPCQGRHPFLLTDVGRTIIAQ